MPRAARAPSNFVNDLHVLYAGWVLGAMIKAGLTGIEPVYDEAGMVTNRVTVTTPDGAVTLVIPPPPDGWRFPL